MRGGAADYLEKPVELSQLLDTVERAVASTRSSRRLLATRREVQEAGRLSEVFPALGVPETSDHFQCFRSTVSELGGDFLAFTENEKDACVFLLGDVSGHDLRAAYISSYFQGFARGLRDRRSSIPEILRDFNAILENQWSALTASGNTDLAWHPVSLAVCGADIDLREGVMHLVNCGCPGVRLSTPSGRCEVVDPEFAPLGWVAGSPIEAAKVDVSGCGFVYCFSDGLIDYASRLEMDAFCMIYEFLSCRVREIESMDSSPPDDIVVMRLQIDQSIDGAALYHPLIAEQYGGNEMDKIDRIQDVWRKSLVFALGDAVEDCLLDILLCCREAVLNGLEHGCDGASGKLCSLVISYCPAERKVRVRVDDAGHGHGFDPEERMRTREVLDGSHLGLVLVSELSHRMKIENHGTSLEFEFDLAVPE